MSKIVAIIALHDSLQESDNDLNAIAEKAARYEQARRIVTTLSSSKGGRIIGLIQGNEIVELPIEAAEVLREIHERLNTELNIKPEIGVGEDSQQANKALEYAKKSAPGTIKVYKPDMEEESSLSVKEPEVAVGPDDIVKKSEDQYNPVSQGDKEKIAQTLALVQHNKDLFDQMQQQAPEAYQGVVSVIQSLALILQQDKIAKEQQLVEMLDKLNEQVKKERENKAKGQKKKFDKQIKRHGKVQDKEKQESHDKAFDVAHKKHARGRKDAQEFAAQNGGDHKFFHKLLNAFR